MAIIFLLSGRERVAVSEEYVVNFLIFKTVHVLEYGILFILYYRALKNTLYKHKVIFWAWAAFVLTIIFALSDEIHQVYVPTREGKLRDVIIDGIGASLAWYGLTHWLPKVPRRLRDWAKSWEII